MERLTDRLLDGSYGSNAEMSEIINALGRFEDQYESLEAELELVRLNLKDLAGAAKAQSATYVTLQGSRFMLEDMLKRLDEPAEAVAKRLEALRRETSDEPLIRDVEE